MLVLSSLMWAETLTKVFRLKFFAGSHDILEQSKHCSNLKHLSLLLLSCWNTKNNSLNDNIFIDITMLDWVQGHSDGKTFLEWKTELCWNQQVSADKFKYQQKAGLLKLYKLVPQPKTSAAVTTAIKEMVKLQTTFKIWFR